jgi:hypothetical protein
MVLQQPPDIARKADAERILNRVEIGFGLFVLAV